MEAKGRVPFRLCQAFLLALLGALILWRLSSRPVTLAWRDWALLLAIYSVFRLFLSPPSRRLELSLMAYFLALYLAGQVPRIVESFRAGP